MDICRCIRLHFHFSGPARRSSAERKVTLKPDKGVSFVNGKQVSGDTVLHHNDRVIMGNSQAFRFVDPVTAAKEEGAGKPK